MVDLSQQLAYAVKEEILRNVLKSHQRMLVLGLGGTGKTFCTLRAAAGLGSIWYYTADAGHRDAVAAKTPGVSLLSALPAQAPDNETQGVLLIDDLNRLTPKDIASVTALLKNPGNWLKIVLLSRMLVDSKELMPNIDVVVKMKEKTAEMMYSNLQES